MDLNNRIQPLEVVVAGGGVAALEAIMALHDMGEQQLRLTLVAPQDDFALPPLSVGEAFGASTTARYPTRTIMRHFGTTFVADRLDRVLIDDHVAYTGAGEPLRYDALIIAVGAHKHDPYSGALSFGGSADSTAFAHLLGEVRRGETRSLAFVVPPGVSWPLPLYELALMTARDAPDATIELVTPEPAALALFGEVASDAVASLLEAAGVRFHGSSIAAVSDDGREVELEPGGMSLAVDRVVTLPLLGGAPIRGIPCDEAGFVPVDEHCRVIGAPGLYAVGDCTDCAIKQGGLATQEADAAAAHIAAAAGALVPAEPFSPVLRGRLMTGGVDQFLSRSASGESRSDDVSLWWPPAKVSGRYIAPWLARWDTTLRVDKPAQASLEVEMPFPSGTPSAALAGFTPYSP